jgi:hypothetical protein
LLIKDKDGVVGSKRFNNSVGQMFCRTKDERPYFSKYVESTNQTKAGGGENFGSQITTLQLLWS